MINQGFDRRNLAFVGLFNALHIKSAAQKDKSEQNDTILKYYKA